jgi:uncharacterized protein YceH (UPF0502 family)
MSDDSTEPPDARAVDGAEPDAADAGGPGATSANLTSIEGRVLGCLLEKQRTTPDQYPLTLNALVSACNQTSSREPVMAVDEHEVAAALASLKSAGWVRFVHPSHGRSVIRYRHVADERLGADAASLTVLGLLLLRGPQTDGELRTRSERWYDFPDLDAVAEALAASAASGLVHLLGREPGRKEPRWQQLVAEEPARPVASGAPSAGSVADRLERLESALLRVAELERRVEHLERQLAAFADSPAFDPAG